MGRFVLFCFIYHDTESPAQVKENLPPVVFIKLTTSTMYYFVLLSDHSLGTLEIVSGTTQFLVLTARPAVDMTMMITAGPTVDYDDCSRNV